MLTLTIHPEINRQKSINQISDTRLLEIHSSKHIKGIEKALAKQKRLGISEIE